MIQVKNLTKRFSDGYVLLENVNCEINKGDVVSVIGPSGCGKSIFLRMLNGLEIPSSGEVWIDGQNIFAPGTDQNLIRRKVGMVTQSIELFGHLNVLDNITLGPVKLLGKSKAEAESQAVELLRVVGLAEKAEAFPDQLSGGQRQRVAIARSLAMDPEVMLFDEPTSSLDTLMIGECLAVIRDLAKRGMTMVIVTHELKFCRDVCNRVIYFDDKGIYEDGTPEHMLGNDSKPKTRAFVQGIKGISFDARSKDYDLYELNSQIEMFCTKYALGQKYITIELMVEELLATVFKSDVPVHISVEYVDLTSDVMVTLSREASAGNLLSDIPEDDLSLMIIKGFCSDVKESTEEDRRVVKLLLRNN